jgi:hypothetical protein
MPVPICGRTGGVVFRIYFRISDAGAQREKEEPGLEDGNG